MNRRLFLKRVLATIAVLVVDVPKKIRRAPDNKQLDLNTDTVGETGGYYVPPEFRDSILALAKNKQAIRGPTSITVYSGDKQWRRMTRDDGNDGRGE